MKRIAAIVLALALFALSGCMETSADDLYALPQLSEGYLQLQSAIDQVLASGAEYAAPSSGANRQSIQREDIDGDGVREVIAFFNMPGSDRPLKVIIFRSDEDGYRETARIEGEGTGIDSVSYLDMDSDGIREIAVGWQMGAGINMLSVYSLKSWNVSQILNTNYSEFTVCSLDDERGSEILALRLSSSDLTGEAQLYSLTADGEVVNSTARLSNGVEALRRVRSTQLLGGAPAILVESTIDSGSLVTDIFIYRGGKLQNAAMDENVGVSTTTVRVYAAYCRDINSDGVLDVPSPQPLPTSGSDTTYYTIDWYSFYSYGGRRLVCTTYSNYTDSWYLILPEEWKDKITVRRADNMGGERAVVFSTLDGEGNRAADFLAIYTLTGERRDERATMDDRFVLLEEEETVYAAKIWGDPERLSLPLSQELLRENFGFIYSEWITGET